MHSASMLALLRAFPTASDLQPMQGLMPDVVVSVVVRPMVVVVDWVLSIKLPPSGPQRIMLRRIPVEPTVDIRMTLRTDLTPALLGRRLPRVVRIAPALGLLFLSPIDFSGLRLAQASSTHFQLMCHFSTFLSASAPLEGSSHAELD